MSKGDYWECGKCGETFIEEEAEVVNQSLYGIVIEKKMRCPHCKSMTIYHREGVGGGRYTNAYSYIAQLKA